MKAHRDEYKIGLHGRFRDVLKGSSGEVIWDSGWQRNAILDGFRRLLAGFVRGAPTNATPIQALQLGSGNPAWDQPPGAPPVDTSRHALVDPSPYRLPREQLRLDYLSGDTPTEAPTNRLQIVASLSPGVPPWPDADHPTSTLREFGLLAELEGAPLLINYRTHQAIPKDQASTLERTIWLEF